MTGTSIKIDLDDCKVNAVLDQLLRAGAELSDPMKEMTEQMLYSTQVFLTPVGMNFVGIQPGRVSLDF